MKKKIFSKHDFVQTWSINSLKKQSLASGVYVCRYRHYGWMCVVSKTNHKSKQNPPKPGEECGGTVRTQLDATTWTISHHTIGAIYKR